MNSKLLAICVGQSQALFGHSGPPPSAPDLARTPAEEPAPVHRSAIRKKAVSTLDDPQPIDVGFLGVAGDEQVDRTVHGGPARAVYAYPAEHYPFWTTVRAQAKQSEALVWGAMGENLVLQGLLETQLWLGDHVYVGAVQFRVEAPRQPCFKFNTVMGFRQASKMMVQSGFTGVYLSVLTPGVITAGDSVRVAPGDRVLSLAEQHSLSNRNPQRSLW
jgi:MOSC domain-containing protein YiiM